MSAKSMSKRQRGGFQHCPGRALDGLGHFPDMELTLKYLTAKIRLSMNSIDHFAVHIERPYKAWTTKNDCVIRPTCHLFSCSMW